MDFPKTQSDEQKVATLLTEYRARLKPEESEQGPPVERLTVHYKRRFLFWLQLRELLRREAIFNYRDKRELRARILRQIVIGLLIIPVFWKLNGNTRADIYGLAGAIYFMVTNQFMMNLQSSVLSFQLERPLFLREQAEQMYGVAPYYLAKVLIELPILVLSQTMFTCIVYFGVGLSPNAWLFLRFLFVMLLVSFASSAFGHFISVLFTEPEMAVAISPIIMLPLTVLGGFFTNTGSVVVWIAWLQYVSPVRYGFEAALSNEFSRREVVFNPVEFLGFGLGYAATMFILLGISIVMRLVATAILKLRVTRVQ